ncbi:unnamed protein product [Gadus morhua 'NCC']
MWAECGVPYTASINSINSIHLVKRRLWAYRKSLMSTESFGTTTPSGLSLCPSGKPETMYHLPHRFGGRDCGFQVDPQVLQEFKDLLPPTKSLCGDDNLQAYFANCEKKL